MEIRDKFLNYYKFQTASCDLLSSNEIGNEDFVVSFAIPSYRRTKLFLRLLKTLMEMERPFEFEVVITEDTREEDHIATIKEFLEKSDLKYRYYYNNNRLGLYPNWNQAISLCKGNYFCLLHTDDIVHRCLLSSYKNYIDKYDVLTQQWHYLYPQKTDFAIEEYLKKIPNLQGGKIITSRDFLRGFGYPLLGSIIKKSVLNDVGYFPIDNEWSTEEDYIFMSKVSRFYTVFQLNSDCYGYIIEDNCMLSCDGWEKSIIERFFLRKELILCVFRNIAKRILWIQFAYIKVIIDLYERNLWLQKYSSTKEIIDEQRVFRAVKEPWIWKLLKKPILSVRNRKSKKAIDGIYDE